jgi:uncharacterized protein (TIGR00661 family)
VRGLTIARHFREHEFLFVSSWMGADVLRSEFAVLDCPQPESPVHRHRLSLTATLISALKMRTMAGQITRRLQEAFDRFQPDVTISDYEHFVPFLSRRLGVPCLSLDHQHIITACRHQIPWRQLPGYLGAYYAIRTHFNLARDYLVISFFQPPTRPGVRARILPPLLRDTVLARQPHTGDHVVAYQGYTTFDNFFTFLKHIPSPVRVYGFDEEKVDGNLQFKKKSEAGFLDDLASCRYVVCGGSHTLISEALYFGKPVISFPIKNQIEQFLNAWYLDHLGYGRYFTGFRPPPALIPAFEARLDQYRAAIQAANFCGNPEIYRLVDRFIRQKTLD